MYVVYVGALVYEYACIAPGLQKHRQQFAALSGSMEHPSDTQSAKHNLTWGCPDLVKKMTTVLVVVLGCGDG